MGFMMLMDMSKCIGCRACQIACQQWHQLPAEETEFRGTYQNPEDVSSANLTLVRFFEVGNNGDLRWLFFVDRCRHCETPLCALNCPLHAIYQFSVGFVTIIASRCNPELCSPEEIKPCQLACPFKTLPLGPPLGMPRYQLNNGETIGTGKANKCDFCWDRWRNAHLYTPPFRGQFTTSNRPACQVACPTRAIVTGSAGGMTLYAAGRVAYLKANGYPDANIYPKAYDTHVIWILLEDPGVYGLDPL